MIKRNHKPLFPWFGISFFSIIAMSILLLLFPQKILISLIVNSENTSPLTIAYLKDLIHRNPENIDYKISLAKQEMQLGNLSEAERIIQPYLSIENPIKIPIKWHWEAKFIDYNITRLRAFELPEHSLRRLFFEKHLENTLYQLQKSPFLSLENSIDLGDSALAFNHPGMANGFYRLLLNSPTPLSPHRYEKAGQAALYVSDYPTSIKFYQLAIQNSAGAEKRRLILALTQIALRSNQPKLAEEFLEPVISLNDYDENTFQLAYTIYLLNNHIAKAKEVAFVAVQQSKTSNPWRKRLAQVAIWANDPALAAEQYLQLSRTTLGNKILLQGIQLAQTMHDDRSLIQFITLALKKKPSMHDKQQLCALYIDALLRLGQPKQALALLATHKPSLSRSFYLLSCAKIYGLTNEITLKAQHLKQYSDELGITPEIALQRAEIYLANGQVNKAAHVMFMAKKEAIHDSNYPYWKAYAAIALLTNHPEEERYAYLKLLQKKRPSERVFDRLINLYMDTDPLRAYQYAKQGKNAFPNSLSIALHAFSLCLQNHAWQDFPMLEATTKPRLLQTLLHDPTLREVKAYYLQSIGQHDAAVQTFFDAVLHLPSSDYLKSDFIFFLIQTNDLSRLNHLLALWNKNPVISPTLWAAYAEGYFRLNNISMMLPFIQLYYDQLSHYRRDPHWLMDLKNVLDGTYFSQQSWAITHEAWGAYLNLLAKQAEPPDYVQRLNVVKLALQEAPGDQAMRALLLLQNNANPETELLMLSWAFIHNNYALADAIHVCFKMKGILPASWAALSMALYHQDRMLMRDLITHPQEDIPAEPTRISSYRDAVQAATKIDDISLAQQIAFESLERHPHDSDLYDHYFTQALLKTSNQATMSQSYYQYADVEGPRTEASIIYYPTPSLNLKPYYSRWFSNQIANTLTLSDSNIATSNQLITNVPAYDERMGLQVAIAQSRGELLLNWGHRSDLNSFQTARIQRQYLMHQDLNTTIDLGYHQLADDSLGLLVGGMKNNAHLSANYRLSAKETMISDLFQNFFYTQSGQHVANDVQATLKYNHQLYSAYPDWMVSVYGTGASYYQKTSALTGRILTLVPQGVTANASFLIPHDFVEYGVAGSFGQHFIEDYTHAWCPFGLVSFSNNTNVGFGTLFNLGISGHVFGRDKLLLYYDHGINQGTGIQIQRLAKISYSLFF
jgi:hypothetical protein